MRKLTLARTHIHSFFPIPITMVVDKGFLSVPIVHLTDLSTQLVALRPVVFRCFTVKVSGIYHIG